MGIWWSMGDIDVRNRSYITIRIKSFIEGKCWENRGFHKASRQKLPEEGYKWSRNGNEIETADIFEYQYETEEKELDDSFFFCKW